ncbi:MAG: JAB domain-containing protein [Desulfovermiculus sp.]|nr:JAB domain-containing protein [Desulfovermiculus sp.]
MYKCTDVQNRKKALLQELYAMEPAQVNISQPEEAVVQFLRYRDKPVEYFLSLSLDNKNNLIKRHEISKGTVDQSPVFVREVFKFALVCNCSGIVLGHNHPGGDPTPSRQDIELTEVIHQAAKHIGIRVLDHIIVARNGHFSFLEHGYVK